MGEHREGGGRADRQERGGCGGVAQGQDTRGGTGLGPLEAAADRHADLSAAFYNPAGDPHAGSDAPTEPAPPRIGRYRVVARVGAGGMGVVYKAEQDRPRRVVALKVLQPGAASRQALRRFEHEAEVLARLEHPGIARLYEAGSFDDGAGPQPYFAMEYVDGKPLTEYAQAAGLDRTARIELMIRVCEAVEHAHQKGVIHRDLKPANILVSEAAERRSDDATKRGPNAEPGQPKVLDFGVARAVGGEAVARSMATMAGQIVGTLAYMSPEQARGNPEDVDTRCDVYSLGVVAFELLTGRLPHDLEGRSVADATRIIGDVAPMRLSSIDRALRGDLDTILATALEKDRARRYQSAAALAADLRRFLNDEPILARPPSAAYQVRKFVRRHRLLTGAAVMALVSLLAGLALLNQARVEAVEARVEAERQYHEARRMSSYFLSDVVERLDRLLGSAEIRRDLLAEILRQTRAHLADRPDDPQLLDDHARTLHAMADVQQIAMNDIEAAQPYIDEAVAVRERLVELAPINLDYHMELAVVYVRRGNLARMRGDAEACMEDYLRALEIDARLVEQNSHSRRYLDNWFWDHDRIALELRNHGDPDAERWARRALDIADQLAQRFPEHYLTALALAQANWILATVLVDMGAEADAAAHAAASLRHAVRLNEMYANSSHFLHKLLAIAEWYGSFAMKRGDEQSARDAFIKMRDAAEQLAMGEPESAYWASKLRRATEYLRSLDAE